MSWLPFNLSPVYSPHLCILTELKKKEKKSGFHDRASAATESHNWDHCRVALSQVSHMSLPRVRMLCRPAKQIAAALQPATVIMTVLSAFFIIFGTTVC